MGQLALAVVGRDRPAGARREIAAADGFEARCLQHEIDHLDGLLFLDRVDSLTDDGFRRRSR